MRKTAAATLLDAYHLLTYDMLDSTNDEARRLAGGGASHGAVIWARKQTHGRGRLGREWISADGNLFATVLLKPEKPLPELGQLSFVAALAVAETLEGIIPKPEDVRCKWPNDVLIDGKKVAGILLESFSGKEFVQQRWVAVGVGVNVDNFPQHVMMPATSLRAAGVELISAKIVLSRFVHHFVNGYDRWIAKGFSVILKEWHSRAHQLGKPIDVVVGDVQHHGVFEGVDEAGQLLLRDKKQRTVLSAGDVFFKEQA